MQDRYGLLILSLQKIQNQIISFYNYMKKQLGYNPSNPETDQGGNEQLVLQHLKDIGIPLKDGSRDKMVNFLEVGPKNNEHIKTVINNFGLCYIGFEAGHANRVGPPVRDRTFELPPEELLLPGHAEGLPDQPVRRADQQGRPARLPRRSRSSASSGPTSRRTPARRPTSGGAAGSVGPTTRSLTTTGPASPWSRS